MASSSGITIVDESTADGTRSWSLDVADVLEEAMPLREVIRRRIYQEVAEYNGQHPGIYQGLVQPTDAERTLNGYRLRTPRRLDWEAQNAKAIEAFGRRAYIVLVDDRQVSNRRRAISWNASGWGRARCSLSSTTCAFPSTITKPNGIRACGKVQQKVSGCFHSIRGGAAFARIRGYLSTLSKQEVKRLAALETLFIGQPLYPSFG